MHTKMLVYLMFFFFEISAVTIQYLKCSASLAFSTCSMRTFSCRRVEKYHITLDAVVESLVYIKCTTSTDVVLPFHEKMLNMTSIISSKRLIDNPSMTEFPCKFPCPWRNNSFDIYDDKGNYAGGFIFSGDGQTTKIFEGFGIVQLQCYQITERFLIVRTNDTDVFQCYPIFYDIESPLKFQFGKGVGITLNNQTGELTDICEICVPVPGSVFEAVVSESPPTSPPASSLPCNRPSTCTSPPATACNMNDIIPQDCPVTTTESSTTTTEQTTTRTDARTTTEPTKTTKSHCGKKIHKHTK